MPFIRSHSADLPDAEKRTEIDPLARRARGIVPNLSMTSVGLEMGVSVVIGILFGRWLDGKAGTAPWLMILFLIFGFVAGLRGIMREVNKANRKAAASNPPEESKP